MMWCLTVLKGCWEFVQIEVISVKRGYTTFIMDAIALKNRIYLEIRVIYESTRRPVNDMAPKKH